MSNKSLFILVNPVGSLFAKTLQAALKEKVVNKIWRTSQEQGRSSVFKITQNVRNKIEQFQAFQRCGVSCPQFATTSESAKAFNCKTLFARLLINSTNGRGIVEFERDDAEYPEAPLYTEYIPKKYEYRFHVFGDKVIDVQEKRKKRGFENERNARVRNLHNGYVYCRNDINPPDGAADLAIRAVQALGYQYGAVDLIYNEKRNQCYVLEVNSRPGLMGTTLDKYCDAIIEQFNLVRK